MKCREMKKEIEMIMEGKKPSAEALLHAKKCGACSVEMEAAGKIAEALSTMPDERIPSGFNRGVWEKLGEPAPSFFGRAFVPAFAAAGFAAAALVFFLVFSAGEVKVKKQADIAVKPSAAQEKKTDAGNIKAPEPLQPGVQEPVIAQNSGDRPAAAEEKTGGAEPGRIPEMARNAGEGKEYFINHEKENGMKAASARDAGKVAAAPLEVRNNVIRPLSGEAMTVIYRVDDNCDVLIRVYNRKGEPVKTIVSAAQGRGVYTEKWHGEDAEGRVVGDGIYVVHVKTCLTEQKIKAMVVK